jgi:HEAT repeat protein
MYHSHGWSTRKYKTLLQLLLSLILVFAISLCVAAQSQDGPATASTSTDTTPNRKDEAIDAFVIVFAGGLVISGVGLLAVVLAATRRRSKTSDVTKHTARIVDAKQRTNLDRDPGNSRSAATKRPAETVKKASAGYGAYRIDQEVGKLVRGSAHGVEVFASRDPEDRRAIETSLLKTVTSAEFSEEERNRAREALEYYGFIARQCATLLSATHAFDRISAARILGDTGSPSALPFLLEALHDADSTVRNQVVLSIGDLRLPSSMGVLLDMARRHPDVPTNLLNRALSTSSTSGLAFLDESPSASSSVDRTVFDIIELKPLSPVPDLPETSEEESFHEALTGLSSAESDVRREAAKVMAQFPTKESVTRLSEVVRVDGNADVKSTAANSLAAIDHPSVFPAIVLAMVDGSRMVEAAAARALSRVSFDRSEEYVRLLETADEQTLKAVSDACITSGNVQQNIERLANKDPYQAYEMFALVWLAVKAGQTEVVIESIASHPNLDVCLILIHLLTVTHQPEVLDALEQLGNRSDIRDELKIALRSCRTKSEQLKTKPKAEPALVEDDSDAHDSQKPIDLVWSDEGIALRPTGSAISDDLLSKLKSKVNAERAAALNDLTQIGGDDAFRLITHSFDDPSADVRNAAARALYDFNGDRAATFTRALREGTPERRRRIGAAIAGCGLASDAIVNLTVQNPQKTYDAFSMLFLMAKAGEVQPLIRAIETYPSVDVRLAVVTLVALSAQPDIVPTLRRLAVRGSQPDDVITALTEAIDRISTQGREAPVPV